MVIKSLITFSLLLLSLRGGDVQGAWLLPAPPGQVGAEISLQPPCWPRCSIRHKLNTKLHQATSFFLWLATWVRTAVFFFQTTVRSYGSSSLFVLVFQWPFECKKKKQHRALISCLVRVCLIPSRESFLVDALLLTSLLVLGLPLQAFILREPPNPGGIRASAVPAVPSFPATPPRESQGLWHRNLGCALQHQRESREIGGSPPAGLGLPSEDLPSQLSSLGPFLCTGAKGSLPPPGGGPAVQERFSRMILNSLRIAE